MTDYVPIFINCNHEGCVSCFDVNSQIMWCPKCKWYFKASKLRHITDKIFEKEEE